MTSHACICSVISRSYVPFAQVWVDSIKVHHPDVDVLVCVVDDDPSMAPAGSIGVSFDEVADGVPAEIVYRYGRQQLVVAFKSPMLQCALRRGYRRAVFMDVDIMLFDRIDELLDTRHGNLLLTPHLLSPTQQPNAAARDLNILRHGAFNGGCISVAASAHADAALAWFTARLRVACVLDLEQGLHYDQTWLDLLPGMFDGIAVHRDVGCNVAYWNLPERPVALADGRWTAGSAPLRVFHFSGYDPRQLEQPTRYHPTMSLDDVGAAAPLYLDYGRRLLAAGVMDTIELPSGFASFIDGAPVPDVLRELILAGDVDAAGLNPRHVTSNGVRDVMRATGGSVPPAWIGMWRRRPDLQLAYPDPNGVDQPGFSTWIENSGPSEFAELYALMGAGN